MNLSTHYNKIYEEAIPKIREDKYQLDDQIDSLSDNRFGITLLIRPTIEIKNIIQQFLEVIRAIDPEQYYYPNSDLHITVMSIVSCYTGFDLSNISVSEYVHCIEKSLVGINTIEINFKGITVSPSAIMIQGFVNTSSLDDSRNNLRDNFKNSGLEESIDKRYSISTAHSTVVRFRKEIRNKELLIETLGKYRDFDFGKFTVEKFDLVYNDWYQREKFVQQLHQFKLKN
ncbi:2'-5' RNA ligase family protein [Flavobacterium cellulosilyticum]|uniref:Mutarotase n=1 Tax=Flavobacterium cellulosilyticum TaxID=2541731 RepID=A0A4R5C5Y4_9FLAO|nr:mutarotase [Flavobacterium cellulosilyticum]TDD95078.1 mutarotase [Flavobacterium cellulosilyticum]